MRLDEGEPALAAAQEFGGPIDIRETVAVRRGKTRLAPDSRPRRRKARGNRCRAARARAPGSGTIVRARETTRAKMPIAVSVAAATARSSACSGPSGYRGARPGRRGGGETRTPATPGSRIAADHRQHDNTGDAGDGRHDETTRSCSPAVCDPDRRRGRRAPLVAQARAGVGHDLVVRRADRRRHHRYCHAGGDRAAIRLPGVAGVRVRRLPRFLAWRLYEPMDPSTRCCVRSRPRR